MAPRKRLSSGEKTKPDEKDGAGSHSEGLQTSPHRIMDGSPVHRKAHEPTVGLTANRHTRPSVVEPLALRARKPEDRREQRVGPGMLIRHNPPPGELHPTENLGGGCGFSPAESPTLRVIWPASKFTSSPNYRDSGATILLWNARNV